MRNLALILVPLFLLSSCSEQPTSAPAAPAPSFDFSNGPAEPGASYIVRGAYGGFGYFLVDPETELAALITDEACDAFADATLIPFQTIFSPAAEGIEMYHEGGWINTLILEPPYECDDILATGQVKNRWNDNDFFAFLFEHDRANAFGGGANGRVGAYTVSWNFHVTWGGPTRPDFHGAFTETISIQ